MHCFHVRVYILVYGFKNSECGTPGVNVGLVIVVSQILVNTKKKKKKPVCFKACIIMS